MTTTLAATLAAHRAGKSLAQTIEETYARIAAHDDPALFITLRPQERGARRGASDCRRRARKASRFMASPSRSRTISTSRACRPPPPVPPSPTRRSAPPSSCRGSSTPAPSSIGKTNLDQFATGLVGVRSPYGVPRNALRADLIPGGSSSGSADGGRRGARPLRARHRYGGLGPRAGGAQRHRRPEAEPWRAVGERRRPGVPHARHHLDFRARRRRRLCGVSRRLRLTTTPTRIARRLPAPFA